MPDSFTTRQKQYEQILFHRAKCQISGQKGSSHAGYLIRPTEIETLFLAFSPRPFRCFKLSRQSGISAWAYKSVLHSKWSRFLKSICISMSIFLEIMVSILWEKFGNKPNSETAIARWKCLFQAKMPHFFGLTSRDDSYWRLWLCHVCFSTLLSQHQDVCTRLTMKIQEKTFTKTSGGSSNKRRWSAGQNFSSARPA